MWPFKPKIIAPTLNDIQGQWRLTKVGKNGNKAPFFMLWIVNLGWKIEGNKYTIIAAGQPGETGRLVVTPRDGYSDIDQTVIGGDDDGKVNVGIIRLIDGKLEHLQGEYDAPRPAGFPYTDKTVANMALMKRIVS